eukprot:3170001-Prymnesium_polylepis.1
MERGRVEYLLRAYLRTRLQKISKYAIHLGADEEAQSRLSDSEQVFAQGYLDLYSNHMNAAVWDAADCSTLPEPVKDMSKIPTLGPRPRPPPHT